MQNKEATFKPRLDFQGQAKQLGRKSVNYLKTNGKQNIIIIAVAVVLFLLFTIFNSNFAGTNNLVSMSQSVTPYVIMGLGVTFVIATGLIDLSIGTVCIASASIGGWLIGMGMPVWLAIPLLIIIGGLFGYLNGFLVAKLKMPAFIATLGTMMFSRGISYLLISKANVYYPTQSWFNSVFSNAGGFPIGLVWVVLFAVVCLYLMHKCKVGRYILAIGSNEEAARLSGVQTVRYKWIAFTISGIMAGIAAIFWAASTTMIAVGSGNGMELDAIAGVYIGGTSASGGIASIAGSVFGAFILIILRSGINFMLAKFGVSLSAQYLTYVITGIVVVIAVLIDVMKNANANKVKTELLAKKFKQKIQQEISILRLQIDYARSDPKLQVAEKDAKLLELNQQIVKLKEELVAEYPKLKAEDDKKLAEMKATKQAARQVAREEKKKQKTDKQAG